MVFSQVFSVIWCPHNIYIYYYYRYTFGGSSCSFLSFQVHFLELIFSDNQGNGTVSNVLAIIMWPLSGSRRVVTRRVTHIWRTTFLSSWCWMSLFLLCVSTSWPMQSEQITRRQNNKEKKQKTENVINSDSILGLKRDLANKTNALTKGERLNMASDNEKH